MKNSLRGFNRFVPGLLMGLVLILSCSKTADILEPTASSEVPAQSLAIRTEGCITGTLPGGAKYLICLPADWNGDLVVYAHGYVAKTEPVDIPESQLYLDDGTYIPDIITGMGYAFATTSYRDNGLVVQEGIIDLVELVSVFKDLYPDPGHTYLVGASEGGLITVKSIESKKLYSGGLAVCGPIGDFRKQIDYIGDFRVIFDFYFPGVLPGSAVDIPQEVMDNWETIYVPKILTALNTYPGRAEQLIRVTRAAVDPADLSTIANTTLTVLWYNVFATNDAMTRLGGQPFDNSNRVYRGSDDDDYLNTHVQRFRADHIALQAIERTLQTSGSPRHDLVTMHTAADPIVPYWHNRYYRRKIMSHNKRGYYNHLPVRRYGHCSFTQEELLRGFKLLVAKVTAREMLEIPVPLAAGTRQRVR